MVFVDFCTVHCICVIEDLRYVISDFCQIIIVGIFFLQFIEKPYFHLNNNGCCLGTISGIFNLPGSQQILSSGSHYCADCGTERLLLRHPIWLFLYDLHTITTTILICLINTIRASFIFLDFQ